MSRRTRRFGGRWTGFALLVALVVALLVGIAAALIGESVALALRGGVEDGHRVDLEALADAAVADALAHLAADRSYHGLAERTYGPGAIWSDVEPLGLDRWSILAGGALGGERRTVEVEASARSGPLRVTSWTTRPAR